MALMLQLRICLATTLSSVLSNRFLNVTFLLLTGLLTLTNLFPFAPYSSVLHEVIKVMAIIFWLVKKKVYFCSLKMECKISVIHVYKNIFIEPSIYTYPC